MSRATRGPRLRRLIPALFLLVGCGPDDAAMVECRCTENTSVALFPQCLDADLKEQRGNPSSPFATRLPDCPSGQLIFLREPTRPENVLANIRSIFEARPESRSPAQYLDQLAETFTFVPDEEDVQLHPEIYDTSRDTLWDREQERSFARAILDPERIRQIRLIRWYESTRDERILSEDQLRETFIFPYEGEVIEEPVAEDEAVNIIGIKGLMEVDLVTPTVENPVWKLVAWRDLRDPATAKFSWGELRAEFAR